MDIDFPQPRGNWINDIIPVPDAFQVIVNAASASDGTAQDAILLQDLVARNGYSPELILHMLDECDTMIEQLYGMTLFATRSRPKYFRYSLRHPTQLNFSAKFLRVCRASGLLQRVTSGSGKSNPWSTCSIRSILEAANDNVAVNSLLYLPPPQGKAASLGDAMAALARQLVVARGGAGVEIYMPAKRSGEAAQINGGMIAFAAGRLGAGRKVILCGRPDFALSERGFDVWQPRRKYYSLFGRAHAHQGREWVIANTPGVKIWFCENHRLTDYEELFSRVGNTQNAYIANVIDLNKSRPSHRMA